MSTTKLVWENEEAKRVRKEEVEYLIEVDAEIANEEEGTWRDRTRFSEWSLAGRTLTLREAKIVADKWEDFFYNQGMGTVGVRIRKVTT